MTAHTYQVRFAGKQFTATFNSASDDYTINGVNVPRSEVQHLTPFIITAQVWEWYGDEDNVGDPAHGRYKPKGGEDYVIHLSDAEVMYDSEAIIARLNAKMNADGLFFRHEFKGGFSPYYAPEFLKIEDF